MATTEIYVQAKKERIWVSRLREMPEGVFATLVARIAKGDSIREIAKYCQRIRPGIAFETYRKWLQALKRQVVEDAADQAAVAAGQRAIDIFHKRKEQERLDLEAQQRRGPITLDEAETVKANITAVLRNMELSDLLKDAWFIQHRRVRKLVEIEEKLGYSLPDGPKNIDALGYILSLMMKHEIDTRELLHRSGGLPSNIQMEKLSPIAQEVAQLDEVDRNIIQELSHKFANMIEKGTNAAKVKRLGANGSEANGMVGGDN